MYVCIYIHIYTYMSRYLCRFIGVCKYICIGIQGLKLCTLFFTTACCYIVVVMVPKAAVQTAALYPIPQLYKTSTVALDTI